jgi:hypothetical protein
MQRTEQSRTATADRLYQQYGKPLEPEHLGEYVAIMPDGRLVLGSSVVEAMRRATAVFGPGSFVFKIGEQVVGKWR